MEIAARLGRTLHELGETMTADEFGLWAALYRTDPWGEQRADLRAGIVSATMVNMAGMTRARGAPPAKPADFMPYAVREADRQVEEPDPMQHFGAL